MIRERDDALARLARYEPPDEILATVVIPYYAQPEYLSEALCSAVAQTAGLLEVIVVDDGSPDPTARELVEECQRDEAPVRYLRVTNRGLPNARNVGLMNARGRALVPLDADDWLDPTFLEKTLPLLAEFDAVQTGLQEHGTRTGTYAPGTDRPVGEVTADVERAQNHLWYCGAFRTDLLREVGGWNGRMVHGYEDWDLWVDLLQRGARLAGVPEVLFHYRTRPDSMLVSISPETHAEIVEEMRRHGC